MQFETFVPDIATGGNELSHVLIEVILDEVFGGSCRPTGAIFRQNTFVG